jgi:hypothetical protein
MTKVGRIASLFATLALVACAPGMGQPPRVAVQEPPPDGTASYESSRVPFYHRALIADQQQADANATNQGIAALGAAATIGGLIAGGRVGTIVAAVGALTAVVAALNSNVQTDQRFIADVSVSFSALVQCRQAEAQRIRTDVRARRIKATDGKSQLLTLRELMLTDVDVARRVNYALAQRNRTYVLAAADMDTRLASEPNPAERQQRGVQVAQARQTIQSNQRALTDQVSAIDRAAQTITVSSIELPQAAVRKV